MKSLPKGNLRTSLVVQWYITRCSNAESLISGWGTEILHAVWFSQNEIEPQLSRTSGCRLSKLLFFSPPLSPGVCSRLSKYICKLLKSASDIASASNWRLCEAQQMAKPIQFSKCVFSIRCSYVLLEPAGLKSSLGEKYMVFSFMVMSQNSGHLSYIVLFFFYKG